jgi:hypothetical protein
MSIRMRPTLLALTLGMAALAGGPGATAQSLEPLPPAQSASMFRRVPGCDALVHDAATVVAAIASGTWVTYRVAGRPLEAPVVFRDAGEDAPEVRFSVTGEGDTQRGVLRALGAGARCAEGPEACRVLPARLTLHETRRDGTTSTVHDGEVTVTDPCAGDRKTRLFRTTAWWEKLLRMSGSH